MHNFYLDEQLPVSAIEKDAGFKISSDPRRWPQEVITQLHEQHPYLPDAQTEVSIGRTDEESGTGVGSIQLNGKVSVPFIIKNFSLQPFDILIGGGDVVPFSRGNVDRYALETSIGSPVDSPMSGGDVGLASASSPPYSGKFAFAHVIPHTVEDVKAALLHSYTEDGLTFDVNKSPLLVAGIQEYVKTASIQKEASAAETPVEFTVAEPRRLRPIDSGPGLYSTLEGLEVGILFDKVASLTGTDVPPAALLTARGAYAPVYTALAGKDPIPAQFQVQTKLAGRGVFHRINDEGQAVCTEPVRVIARTPNGALCQTDTGATLTISKHASFDDFEVIDDYVYLSDEWQFSAITGDAIPTTWSMYNRLNDVGDVTIRQIENVIYAKGDVAAIPGLSKLADGVDYEVFVTEFGRVVSQDQLDEVLLALSREHEARIKVVGQTKVASKAPEVPKISDDLKFSLLKCAAYMTEENVAVANRVAVKLGSTVGTGESTVDASLSLNFLSAGNLSQFVDNVGQFEECRTMLGHLLIAARLGLNVNAQIVRNALFGIDAVIAQLKTLRSATTEQQA